MLTTMRVLSSYHIERTVKLLVFLVAAMSRLLTVEITNRSVIIDSRDVSNMVSGVQFSLTPDDFPVLKLEIAVDEILYSGSAVVPKVPLDGIERLRHRLARHQP